MAITNDETAFLQQLMPPTMLAQLAGLSGAGDSLATAFSQAPQVKTVCLASTTVASARCSTQTFSPELATAAVAASAARRPVAHGERATSARDYDRGAAHNKFGFSTCRALLLGIRGAARVVWPLVCPRRLHKKSGRDRSGEPKRLICQMHFLGRVARHGNFSSNPPAASQAAAHTRARARAVACANRTPSRSQMTTMSKSAPTVTRSVDKFQTALGDARGRNRVQTSDRVGARAACERLRALRVAVFLVCFRFALTNLRASLVQPRFSPLVGYVQITSRKIETNADAKCCFFWLAGRGAMISESDGRCLSLSGPLASRLHSDNILRSRVA